MSSSNVPAHCRVDAWITGENTVELQSSKFDGPLRSMEMVVRNKYSLISPGTELALFTGEHIGFKDSSNTFAKYPLQPGYASVGVVTEAASDTHFRPGTLVYHEGPHSSHARLQQGKDRVLAIPRGLAMTHAPFTRLAQIASTARYICGTVEQAVVHIVGMGLIGNLAAQIFGLSGAQVLGCDLNAERCSVARRSGVENVVDNSADILAAIAEGRRDAADITVDSTGAPGAVIDCLRQTRRFGKTVLLGSTRGMVDLDVYTLIHRTGISLTGAHVNLLPTVCGRYGKSVDDVTSDILGDLSAGRMVVEPLISDIIMPEEIGNAYRRLRSDPSSALGILINWERGGSC